jgi:hypothetical protein
MASSGDKNKRPVVCCATADAHLIHRQKECGDGVNFLAVQAAVRKDRDALWCTGTRALRVC